MHTVKFKVYLVLMREQRWNTVMEVIEQIYMKLKKQTNEKHPSCLESDSFSLNNSGLRYALRRQNALLSVSQYIRQILNTTGNSYAPT